MTDERVMSYDVLVRELAEDDGGGYVALVPDLRGCMGDGDTPEEAIADVREAIIEWCHAQRAAGREVPSPGASQAAVTEQIKQLVEVIDDQEREIKVLRAKVSYLEMQAGEKSLASSATVSWSEQTLLKRSKSDWALTH